MPDFYFTGNLCHPATILIRAKTYDEAEQKAKGGDFDEIVNEQDGSDVSYFEFNGDGPSFNESFDDTILCSGCGDDLRQPKSISLVKASGEGDRAQLNDRGEIVLNGNALSDTREAWCHHCGLTLEEALEPAPSE